MSAAPDDEDIYVNPALREQHGVVAVWLNTGFSPGNRVIGWFDEDYCEADGAENTPLRELFTGFSYAQSWISAAVTAAHQLGISTAASAWILYDHEYDCPPGLFTQARDSNGGQPPYYLGAFPYTPAS